MKKAASCSVVYFILFLLTFPGCSPDTLNPFDPQNPNRRPDPPRLVKARAQSPGKILVSWANPTGGNGEKVVVERIGPQDTAFAEVASLGLQAKSFLDSLLTSKSIYTYQLRGWHSVGGFSDYSNPASDTTWNWPPSIHIIDLTTSTDWVTIGYTAWDNDDTVSISFYYNEYAWGWDGTLIADSIPRELPGVPGQRLLRVWEYPGHFMEGRQYYVYGIVTDGDTADTAYSEAPFIVPPRPLVLRFTNPSMGDTVQEPVVALRGFCRVLDGLHDFRISDPSGRRYPLTSMVDSTWVADSVRLSLGLNGIAFWVKDQKARIVKDTLWLVLKDQRKPGVAVSGRVSGQQVSSSTIEMLVAATDEYGIDTVFVQKFGGDTIWARRKAGVDSIWIVPMTLSRNANNFFVTARDRNGNDSSQAFSLFHNPDLADTAGPKIHILAPHDSLVTRDSAVTVRIWAEDDSGIVWVRVNGLTANRVSDEWQRPVGLSYGLNWLHVVAADSSSRANQSRDSVRVIYDTTIVDSLPPDIAILEPKEGAKLEDPRVQVRGTADDYSGIDTLIVVCRSDTVSGEYDPVKKEWSAMLHLPEAGDYRILASAKDGIGKSAYDSVSIKYAPPAKDETPPEISILSHPTNPDTVFAASQVIRVEVIDPSPIKAMTIGGEKGTRDSGQTYMRNVSLTDGSNRIRIVATDQAGNIADTTLTLVLEKLVEDETPPQISILSHPVNPDTVFVASQVVRVEVIDASPIKTMTIGGEKGVGDTGSTYIRSLTLKPGSNEIQIAAVDEAGIRADTTLTLVYEDFPVRIDSLVAKGSKRVRAYLSRKPGIEVEQYDLSYYLDAGLTNRVWSMLWSSPDTFDVNRKLVPGVTYYFLLKVKIGGVTNHVTCNVKTCATEPLEPVDPVLTGLPGASPAISVTWNPSPSVGVTEYRAYYSTSPGVDTLATLGGTVEAGAAPGLSITGLSYGQSCYVRVFVWDADTFAGGKEKVHSLLASAYSYDSLVVREILDLNGKTTKTVASVTDSGNGRITKLQLFQMGVDTLPASIGSLDSLDTLWLHQNLELKSLPETIGNLRALEELTLGMCRKIDSLPSSIGNLTNLKKLHLGATGIRHNFPNAIVNLKNLTILDLRNCSLGYVPPEILGMDSLKELNLLANRLDSLPSFIGSVKTLEHVWVNYNNLQSLPDTLFALPNLGHLYVIGNQTLVLGNADYTRATSLKVMSLQDCRLQELPSQMAMLPVLLLLDTRGNSLCPADMSSQFTTWLNQKDSDWKTTQIVGNCDD